MDLDGEIEMDLVTHDARKFFLMLLGKNGYVLEQIFSPLVIVNAPEFDELRSIAARCITRHHRHHFRSFARHQWADVIKPGKPTVKKLLYAYRPLLAGIHLMNEGRIESNIVTLNKSFGLSYIDDLVAAKLAGSERMKAESFDLAFHERELIRLHEVLEGASENSTLPEEQTGREALNDLLVRLRHGD